MGSFLSPQVLEFVTGKDLDHLLAYAAQVAHEAHQHLGANPFTLSHQAEEDVLGPDVAVAKLQCLPEGQLQHLLRPRGERRGARWASGSELDRFLDLESHCLQGQVELREGLGGDSILLMH
jgi:hypothetical protein